MQMDIRERKKKTLVAAPLNTLITSSMTSSSPVSVWTPQQWHPQWRRHPPDCYCVSYGVDWFFFSREAGVGWTGTMLYTIIAYTILRPCTLLFIYLFCYPWGVYHSSG